MRSIALSDHDRPRPAGYRLEGNGAPRLVDEKGHRLRVDDFVAQVFALAVGQTVEEIAAATGAAAPTRVSLGCLVAAGVLQVSGPRAVVAEADPDPSIGAYPPLSIVVVNYNGAGDLPALMASIRAQRYEPLQVLIVDNASTDNSAALKGALQRNEEWIAAPRNLGFAGGINLGLARATGDYVVVLNSDTVLLTGALRRWVARALACPDAAAIAPMMRLLAQPAFINALGNSVLPDNWGSDNFMGVLDLGQFDHHEEVYAACFGAALLSHRALRAIGPPDPDYFLYYEDLDWCHRARLAGFRIVTAPQAIVLHKFGGSVGAEPSATKLRLVVRNRLRFALINLGPTSLWHYLASYVWLDLRQFFRAALGRDGTRLRAYLTAYGEVVRRLPAVLARRRRVQGLRRPGVTEADILRWNIAPRVRAAEGGIPILSRAVIEAWYVPSAAGGAVSD